MLKSEMLRARADFLRVIREFFDARGVVEVDPPLLYRGVATDPGLEAFAVMCGTGENAVRYLQTSPEFPMKRLLAAGSGPIYYLGKAFRKGEVGDRHNPEFTMLEWYRPGWDHWQLIDEVDNFFAQMVGMRSAERVTYCDIFKSYFGIDPHVASVEALQQLACAHGWTRASECLDLDHSGWLELLFSYGIEPHLGKGAPTVVYDFPASQASLARTREVVGPQVYRVAERFEFYYAGMELANGYHELTCANEQRARFEADRSKRAERGLAVLPVDEALLEALSNGFPPCAGVALGVDRLLMIKQSQSNIANILPLAWEQA